jgi:quinone-modifying oxidoreductase subunit QmoC
MEQDKQTTQRLFDLVDEDLRLIKYEAELDKGFGRQIAQMAHGEKFRTCIQCGNCSATCPVSHFMDYTPRQIIAMVRAGFKEEVLRSFTIWICASCHACTADCPREIKITDIMYALKQLAIKEGIYPKRFPIPVMAEEFYKIVEKQGRNSEGRLMINIAMKTNPFRLLRFARVGLNLFRTGRASLREEGTKNKGEIKALLQAVDRAKEAAR